MAALRSIRYWCLTLPFASFVALSAAQALAADGTWNGGAGATWDTSTTNWLNLSGTPWDVTNGGSNTAIFNTAGATATVSGGVFANGITFANTATISGGTINLAGTTPTITTTFDGTVSSFLAGSSGFTKSGAGTLTLSGSNGYSGGTTVTGGILRLSSTAGAGSGAVALAGGTLSLFRSGATTTYANAIGVAAGQAGTLSVDGSGTNSSTYATGTITVGGALTVIRTSGSTANTIFDARLVGSGTLVVDNTNGGTTPVSGVSQGRAQFQKADNTFNGDVVIRNGGNFLNSTANPSYRSVDIGANSFLTLVALSAASPTTTTVSTLTGAGTVIRNSQSTSQTTLSVGGGDFSGVISTGNLFGGDGTIALRKTGTGTLTLSGANTYTGATTVTGGTLQIGNGGTTGSLSTTSAISVASGATLAFRRSNTITQGTDFNSVISGSGGVAQLGSGTLVLGGANTYTGTTTINAGILQIGNNGATGSLSTSSVITGSAGATLAFRRTNTVTQGSDFASVIGDAINVSQLGSGTLVLGGANTYTGTTTIDAGTLQIGNNGTTGSLSTASVITGSAGATLAFSRTDTVTQGSDFASVIGSAINVSQLGLGTLVLNGVNTYTGTTRIVSGGLTIGDSLALQNSTLDMNTNDGGTVSFSQNSTLGGLTGARNLDMLGLTLSVGNNGQSTTYSGTLSNGGLTKVGSGTLVLGGANTYTGTTAINAGTLQIGNNGTTGSLSTASVITGSAGATLAFSRTDTVTQGSDFGSEIGSAINVSQLGSGTLVLNGVNTYTGSTQINAGTLEIGGAGVLGNGSYSQTITNSSSFVFSSSATQTLAGRISGPGSLAKSGAGTLTLSGSNGYSGGTTVTGGILRLTSTNGAGSGAVALAGGTLSLFRSGTTTTYANAISVAAGQAGSLQVDGSGTNAGTGNNSTYATGTLAAHGTLTVSRATGGTGSTVFSGTLVGSGTLVVDNTNGGVIPVSGTSVGRALFNSTSNTFSGDVVIRNGGNFMNNTANPSYRSVDIGANSFLTLVAPSAASPTTTTVSTLTGAGTVIRNSQSTSQTTLSVGGGDFSGVISSGTLFSGNGTIALTKTGTGTLSLSGANTYTGATTVTGGTLQIGNGGTTGSLSTSSAISVASGATLAFRRSNTITQGTDFNSVISGSGGVAQLGSGTLVLGGANTYLGRTLVSAGVLALGVNGSFGDSNEIKVGDAGSSGAILDLTAKTAAFAIGTGQTLSGGGTVLVAPDQQFLVQGTFSPGNSPGLFTFDAGTTVLSGTTVMEIFGTSRATSPSHGSGFYDAVNIVDNGMLQFGGNLTLEFSGLFDTNTTFDLFTPASGSTLGGNFTGVAVIGGFYTGLEWNQTGSLWKSSSTTAGQSLEFSAVTGQLVIVPEPSTIALLAAAGGIALLHRNRRRLAHRKAVEHSRVERGTATGSCPLSSMSQRL